ncbi:MAG: late competence development ComFB family protein [Clostridiaceae bacterium]|nr:late competence development ComFB family protein [Clostridiaceae bacterium]
MQLKNYMEEVVKYAVEEILHDINVCQCERCKLDIIAKSLNDLPPKYVITPKGEVYSKINKLRNQFEVDVIAAVTKAAILVKRNPSHDEHGNDRERNL